MKNQKEYVEKIIELERAWKNTKDPKIEEELEAILTEIPLEEFLALDEYIMEQELLD